MDVSEYIEAVTGQMRCKRARQTVAGELTIHIEDQTLEYLAEGMSPTDRIHRPRIDWRMIAGMILLSIMGGVIQYMILMWRTGQGIGTASAPENILTVIRMLITGWTVLIIIRYADYTLLGKYAVYVWVGLMLLPFVPAVLWSFFSYSVLIRAYSMSGAFVTALCLPAYAGLIFHYKNKGLKGFLLCLLWLGAFCLCLLPHNKSLFRHGCILFGGLLLLTVAVAKKWFHLRRFVTISALWGGALLSVLGALYYIFTCGQGYQATRLAAFLAPSSDPGGAGFLLLNMRDILSQVSFAGKMPAPDLIPANNSLSFLFLLSQGGWLSGILLVVLFLAIFLFMAYGIRKQKNMLGSLIALACALSLLLAVFIHISACLTLIPSSDIDLPFCSPSDVTNLSSYLLAGIYLSVYRYTDVVA